MANDIINYDINNPYDIEYLHIIVSIVEKYLCLNDDNNKFIKSEYTILQFLARACFYQIIQIVYKITNKKDMNITDLDEALTYFKLLIKASGLTFEDPTFTNNMNQQ